MPVFGGSQSRYTPLAVSSPVRFMGGPIDCGTVVVVVEVVVGGAVVVVVVVAGVAHVHSLTTKPHRVEEVSPWHVSQEALDDHPFGGELLLIELKYGLVSRLVRSVHSVEPSSFALNETSLTSVP